MQKLFVFILCLPLLFVQATQAQQGNLVPVEAFGQLESKSMMAVSPSGQFVAYRAVENGMDYVIVVETDNFKMVSAVNVENVKPNQLYFVDEDKLIMVVTRNSRIAGYRGRHEISHAFAFNLTTSKLHQMLVAGAGGTTAGQSNLGRIVGISEDKTKAFMPAYDDQGELNLYRASLERRGKPRILMSGQHDTIDFFMGENDKVIARESYDNKDRKHKIESRLSGKWKVVFEEETDYITKGFVGVTPDKQNLVMSAVGKDGFRSYYALSLVDGSITDRLFSQDGKGVERPITDINRVIHGVEYSGFRPTYEFFDKKLNARMNGVSKALPDYVPRITDYTNDWNNIIFYADGKGNPGSYLMYKKGALSFIANTRQSIPLEGVGVVKEYVYEARDGVMIPTLLTFPYQQEEKNLPAIMMPHGGPEAYDKMKFDYLAQYFASRGYLVIQPQFRGSTGFGAEHTLIGRGEWGRKMQDDLTDGLKHLAEKGLIDDSKVCIVGASYGGYAALAGAVFTPELYKCAISINGVSDIPSMMKTERRQYGRNHWVVRYWEDVIANGDFEKDHLEQISPINHVKNVNAPILLIHGLYDEIVPWKQSDNIYDELRDEDKDVTFVKLEKGDHYLSTAENRMKAMQAIEEFMKTHML